MAGCQAGCVVARSPGSIPTKSICEGCGWQESGCSLWASGLTSGQQSGIGGDRPWSDRDYDGAAHLLRKAVRCRTRMARSQIPGFHRPQWCSPPVFSPNCDDWNGQASCLFTNGAKSDRRSGREHGKLLATDRMPDRIAHQPIDRTGWHWKYAGCRSLLLPMRVIPCPQSTDCPSSTRICAGLAATCSSWAEQRHCNWDPWHETCLEPRRQASGSCLRS